MNKEKKYELIKTDSIERGRFHRHTLYRIRAIRDFGNIKAGTVGGYIEKESNLSHEGLCWVEGNSNVYGDAIVYENALISDNAVVKHMASVGGKAHIFGEAKILNMVKVTGSALVYKNAIVCGRAQILDNAEIGGNAYVGDDAVICESAVVCKFASIEDNAHIGGNAYISGDYNIGLNAYIKSIGDALCITGFDQQYDPITFYVDRNKNIYASTEYFYGTLKKFKKETIQYSGHYKEELRAAAKLAKAHFSKNKKGK